MSKLFSPMQLGPYELSHRVIMALLTRTRSKPGDMPGDLMVEYYTQRASKGGLLRSEEHTSETPVTNAHLVCRLLLEKKNNNTNEHYIKDNHNYTAQYQHK